MRASRVVHVRQPTRGLRFIPGSVRSWLGTSPSELVGQVVPLSAFRAVHDLRSLGEVLQQARASEVCPRVARVVRALQVDPARSVRGLAIEVGWTERHLRRRVTLEVGYGPRRLGRIFRLQRLVGQLHRSTALGDLAYLCGYADQAHMGREVRSLTGITPSQLRRVTDVRFVQGGDDGQS